MPVFTYDEIMEAARQSDIRIEQERIAREAERRTPEQIAWEAFHIISDRPAILRMYREIPSLQRNTLQRVVCMLADHKPTMIHIAVNGVWSADLEDGGTMFSYEKLDYHTGAREFLEALRAAGIPFTFHGDKIL